jgi:mannan polymerase II complex MNN11 subunit
MQFALPPRKSTQSPFFVHPFRSPLQRRRQPSTVALLSFALLLIIFLLLKAVPSQDSQRDVVLGGTPKVVIVTVLDHVVLGDGYMRKIIKNREDYATRHGTPRFIMCSKVSPINILITHIRRLREFLCQYI